MIPPARYDVPLLRVLLTNSSGTPVTGIAYTDANLRVALARDSGGAVGTFTGGSTVLAVSTIGEYAAPGSGNIRWGEVDATYLPGVYELQMDASFWQASRASVICRVYDATATKRWTDCWAATPVYMPARVDHVRDAAQTARDLGANLDAAVSTRSSHSAADVWASASRTLTDDPAGVATLLGRLTSQRAANLDNLDAAVSTRAAAGAALTDVQDQLLKMASGSLRATADLNVYEIVEPKEAGDPAVTVLGTVTVYADNTYKIDLA